MVLVWLVVTAAACRGDHGWRGGTCFFVSPDGLAVTSRHVVVDNRYLMIFDAAGHRYRARVVAEDPVLDLAVLQARYSPPEYLELARTDAAIGDRVIAYEPDQLLPQPGLIIGRRGLGSDALLATTAKARPGSSGGPLVDRAGRVVGVLVRLQPTTRVAFAVKASRLEPLLHALPRAAPVATPPERALCRVGAP